MATAELIVLGSSAAVPMKGRGLPCLALGYRGHYVLLDAGEGCQYRMIEAGVSLHRVRAVLVTHMHGDHFYGLPGLLHSMSLLGRKSELLVVGPQGLGEALEALVRAGGAPPSFPVRLVEARPWASIEIPGTGLKVTSFPVDHTIEAYGYVVEEPRERSLRVDLERLRRLGLRPGPYLSELKRGRTVTVEGRVVRPEDVLVETGRRLKIVYTGDTRPCSEVVKAARNAALLIHDSTFHSLDAEKAYAEGHSTSADAGKAAWEAGAQMLMLVHVSARYPDYGPLVRDASRFHPYVVAAENGLKVVLAP